MPDKKKWLPIAIVVLIVMAASEIYLMIRIKMLDMLPTIYVTMIALCLVLLLLIVAALMFTGNKKHATTGRTVKRVIAIILAAAVAAVSIFASMAVAKIENTVNKVTDTKKTLDAMVGVYVRSDDSAETIEDAKAYTFGIMESYDRENTDHAIETINNAVGGSITTVTTTTPDENLRALYDGQVQAIIMNETYEAVFSGTEDFSDFSERTKLIYEIPIEKEVASSEETEKSASTAEETTVTNVASEPFIMYISGSDTRSQILEKSNSDVNIIAVVNPTSKQVLLLNTPRDYYIPNPVGGGQLDKLTHCGIFGVDNSIAALNNLYGTNINYYAQINFTGLETLVDAIGGVTVYSPNAFSTGEYSFVEGDNTLNGAQALAFARERHAFASGDRERGKNQMRVITAIINKLTSGDASVLMNFGEVLNSLSGMFVTSMSSDDMNSLVKMQLSDMASWNIKQYSVTGGDGKEITYSMPGVTTYVMYQDTELVAHASSLINKVIAGDVLTDDDVS